MSKPLGPYTPIVRAGEWLVVSGQVGLADGVLVDGGLEPQCRQALANLAALLESEGASFADVVKTTVFLTRIADFAVMNDLYVEAFAGHRPARSTIAVNALPGGACFEIEAWARVAEPAPAATAEAKRDEHDKKHKKDKHDKKSKKGK